jgi:hypothetical protein
MKEKVSGIGKTLLLAGGYLLTPALAVAGPITFNTALPVSAGEFILREQVQLLRSTRDPSPLNQNLRVLAVPSVLAYGVTRDLALFGIVPYLDKTLDLTTMAGRQRRGDSGLGDALLISRYTVYAFDSLGETRRLAPFLGLKVPTGKSDQRDSLGRLPQPLQLGSGSWDPLGGLIFTWQTFDWEFDSAVQYRVNTKAHDFVFGDEARLDLSFQYRLWPPELGAGVPAFLYGVIESNLIWVDKNTEAGVRDPNSGGTTWFLAPGIQYVTKRVILEAIVQIPVRQDLNGLGLKNDYIVSGGFRVSF